MPQIKVRGIQVEKLCVISKELVSELEKIIGCPKSYLTIEAISSTYISDGEIVPGYPYIEVLWFDRGQDVQDKTAKAITKLIHKIDYTDVDIIFVAIAESDYYENGEHF